MINVVVFDLDDTLYPEHDYVRSGFTAVNSWIEETYSTIGFYDIASSLLKSGQSGNIFNQTLDYLEISYDGELINTLVNIYRRHSPKINLYEDATWAINHFKNKKKRLAIITDGYLEAQENKVRSLGLESLFDLIICTDKFGRGNWKPSPMPYEKIMETFECEGTDCIYIGDNPRKDFIAAKKNLDGKRYKSIDLTEYTAILK